MANRKPRYGMKEYAERGQSIYKRSIRPNLTSEDDGKFLAVDVETGQYELGESDLDVVERLYGRLPDAQPWLIRVGYTTAHSRGGGLQRETA